MSSVPAAEPKVVTDVRSLLKQNAGQIAKLLPRSIPSERFLAIIMSTFQEDEKLQSCSIASFAKCVLQCAQFGFLPGPRRQVYFVPYFNSKKRCMEAQLIPGYQGLLTLARNSGKITNVLAEAVYDGDEFSYTLGLKPTLVHTPKSPWREEPDARIAFEHMTFVYAIANLKEGNPQFVVITKKRIEGHRDRFSKAKDDKGKPTGPWRDHPIEQSLKTALRELSNLLPSADEAVGGLATAVTIDKQAEAQVPQTLEPFTIDGLSMPVDDEKEQKTDGAQPQQAENVLVLGNFGPHANCRIDDPSVTYSGLEWYLAIIGKNMKNKDRAQFRESDRRELIAIEKELERRKAMRTDGKVAQDATQAKDAATTSAAAGSSPSATAEEGKTAKKAAGADQSLDAAGDPIQIPEDFAGWTYRAQEKYRDLYYKVKDDLSMKTGDAIPVAKRGLFYKTFNDELEKAGKDKLL